ncbi:MAG TPA: NrfD/PsrC family molybdoenzyme membrane anchor subunit [Polyangiaceae bacterium]
MTQDAAYLSTVPVRPAGGLQERELLLTAANDQALTDELLGKIFHPPPWLDRSILVTGLLSLILFSAIAYTLTTGIGTWGVTIPVAWGFAITNFVWWIGIGHAGTFISAFLLLLEQKWRVSINRFAEAMTLFALMQAAVFPLLHLGRAWFFYWLVPYPNEMHIWPQFRSSLTWDVAAVSTYFTVSLLFWYFGLIPDLAAARDRAPERWRRRAYGVFALGWSGSASDWHRHRISYGLLAGIAAPLVISVHSVVSMDFSIGILPGWHSTIFPPYFVAGAIYSGFALVLTLLIPVRRAYRLEHVVTTAHLEKMAIMLMITGLIVTYAYGVETYLAWLGGDPFEMNNALHVRPLGRYAFLTWLVVFCNCVAPQSLWLRFVRRSPLSLFVLSLVIQLGMWLERFVLIVSSQSADFLPSATHGFVPSLIDYALLGGTLCFFCFLFLLFLRFVPFIPISELKALRLELRRGTHGS